MSGRTAVVHYLDEDGELLATVTVGDPVLSLDTREEPLPEFSARPVVRTPRLVHSVSIEGNWWRLTEHAGVLPGVADTSGGDRGAH